MEGLVEGTVGAITTGILAAVASGTGVAVGVDMGRTVGVGSLPQAATRITANRDDTAAILRKDKGRGHFRYSLILGTPVYFMNFMVVHQMQRNPIDRDVTAS
jgi:hypothetical protein